MDFLKKPCYHAHHFMVWSQFKSYFYKPNALCWLAWDPALHHRKVQEAQRDEIVNIGVAAQKYAVPEELKQKLDGLISKKIYTKFFDPNLDENYLKKKGFVIVKNSSTRIFYNKKLSDWFIKISVAETRKLPMEAVLKACQAQESGRKDDVWLPLRNQNLMRAAGKEYLATQLKTLDESVARHFELPEEYIYTCAQAEQTASDHKKYFSISQKKEVYSGNETIELIKDLKVEGQRQVAKKVVALIKKTRIHDWHKDNLVLSKTAPHWNFQLIDSEPVGILIDEKDNGAHLFDSQEHVLLGLTTFRDRYCRSNGLTEMAKEVDQEIVKYVKKHPHIKVETKQTFVNQMPATTFQKVKFAFLVTVSILCPLIPIVLMIMAIFSRCCHPRPIEPYNLHVDTPGLAYAR